MLRKGIPIITASKMTMEQNVFIKIPLASPARGSSHPGRCIFEYQSCGVVFHAGLFHYVRHTLSTSFLFIIARLTVLPSTEIPTTVPQPEPCSRAIPSAKQMPRTISSTRNSTPKSAMSFNFLIYCFCLASYFVSGGFSHGKKVLRWFGLFLG